MPVNTFHRKYEAAQTAWEKVRHGIEGEDAVKEQGSKYLPVPPGLKKGEASEEYQNYKIRARYPETLSSAVEGMIGLMGRKINRHELPEALQYMYDKATLDGLTLDDLQRRVWHEVSAVGRIVLLLDAPTEEGEPYIATYTAESVINWSGDADRIHRVVFQEEVEAPNPEDRFDPEIILQWRVAELDVGEGGEVVYVIRVYRQAEGNKDEFVMVEEHFPEVPGVDFDGVPVDFIGSRDLEPEPDAVPMLPAANKALHYYRQYADFAMNLFMSANGTTPYGTGVAASEAPTTVGPTEFWYAENPGANFGFAEITGAGLAAQKEELENIKAEIASATIRVLGEKKAVEAAETLRLRFQSQTATLTSISQSCTAGLTRILRRAARWVGANPDEVRQDATVQFISEEPDPQVMTALYDGIERGLMPDELLIEYLRRVELHDMDPDDYRKWSAGLMALEGNDEG